MRVLGERPPDKENGPALFADSGRTELRMSRGNDDAESNEGEVAGQVRDRALSLHFRLPDPELLREIGVPWPARASRFEVRDRLIAEAVHTGGDWTSYSRNANWWSRRGRRYLPHNCGRRVVLPEIDLLAEVGLFENDRRRPGDRGLQSRFRASPGLMRLAGGIAPVYTAGETIWLRDEDGEPVDYRDTAETRAMRRGVEALNEALAATAIDLDDSAGVSRLGHILQINEHLSLRIDQRGLWRVFNRSSFALGGRYYGGAWQGLPKSLRPHLTVDGKATVECDFSGCHVRMLAAELGVDLGDGDIYEVVNWPRDQVKSAMLVLINADSRRAAIGRIAQDLGGDVGCYRRAVQLIDAIKARHPGLARAFHSDAGLRLMRIDSSISEMVFARLLARGIVALGVHDSFIVARKNEGELRAEMVSAWRAQLGTNPEIK
jgi:hypothetical protein